MKPATAQGKLWDSSSLSIRDCASTWKALKATYAATLDFDIRVEIQCLMCTALEGTWGCCTSLTDNLLMHKTLQYQPSLFSTNVEGTEGYIEANGSEG